ncbi:MAG: glycosyltransferase family 4 protein [Candidatus Promineifilaceae bacterium]
MRIGIIHYKIGDTDGVSLEIDKWKIVLEELGHKVYLTGGYLGAESGTLIEEMFHHSPEADSLYRQTFIELEPTGESEYRKELFTLASRIEARLRDFVDAHQLDLLIVENIWSVAANPAVAIATAKLVADYGLPSIAHHHDFYWERTTGVCLTSSTALELADKYLPPHDASIHHTVINSLAQHELLIRKGIGSTVIPNVFDFDAPLWNQDQYNQDLRKQIGLTDNDIVILQATRVVSRKGIELAVDFVKALGEETRRRILIKKGLYNGQVFTEDSRIVLVLAGYTRDDIGGAYIDKINRKISQTGIEAIIISGSVDAKRSEKNGVKKYSLWDTYVMADFVSYPSIWEGWGNQLLEAVRARLPFLLFEYPVYTADIAKAGFRAISLGSQLSGRDSQGLVTVSPEVINRAADEALEYLSNPEARLRLVEHNYEMAQRRYSLRALRKYLQPLLANVDKN